jgi:hypothetical protein
MSDLKIELCPETGICSIIKADGKKIDLMPDEVSQLRDASGAPEQIKQVLAEVDPSFADALDSAELDQVGGKLK